jgi:hypothetical protein
MLSADELKPHSHTSVQFEICRTGVSLQALLGK